MDLLVTVEQLTTLSEAPAQSAEAVTPHDSNAQGVYRSLWIGSAGNLSVILVGDSNPVTFNSVPAGTLMPIAVKRVRSTGTTAQNIVGLK